jgi:hypothetical protein
VAAVGIGIAGLVGVIGEVVRDLKYLHAAWKASGKLDAEAERALNLCKEVEVLLKEAQRSSRILSALDHVKRRLYDVAKIASKYKGGTQRGRFFRFWKGAMLTRRPEID